ncbi:MAG: hypothetical protein LQ348_004848 [Seirophora lacunosa]|nr:MAG: hypothetical protein LQ348_004848 [Seirophora lacunosa]
MTNDTLLPTSRHPYARAHSDDGHSEQTDDDASSGASHALTEFPISVPPTPSVPPIQSVPRTRRVALRTWLKIFSFWIATLILTFAVERLVGVYEAKGVLTPAEKSTYNLLATVLILILGLSFAEAFKELARQMGGKLSQTFASSGEEKELILGLDSLLKVVRLIIISPKWSIRAFCIFWLAVNFAALMLSALISLEVTVDDGHNYNGTYHESGKPLVPKIDCFYQNTSCAADPVPIHALAHSYGETTLANPRGDYSDADDLLKAKQDFQVWRRRDLGQYAHRFREYNLDDTQMAYPYFTKRFVTSSGGGCFEYSVDEKTGKDTSGDQNARNFTYRNETFIDTIAIPTADLGREGTTYIYRGEFPPAKASSPLVVCGERYWVARVAAVSIALKGQWHPRIKDRDFHQFQFYAFGAPWEIGGSSNREISDKISEFAMGSLAGMIANNPKTPLDGTVPYLGSRLVVEKGPFTAILVCLVSTHFTVYGLTFMLAHYSS